MEDLTPIVGIVSVFAVAGWIVRTLVVNLRQHKIARIQADMQTRLLEKFGSSQEMLAYLQSDAGRRFLESATIERTRPHGRILGSLQAGIILCLAGIAFLVLEPMMFEGTEEGFLFLGVLGLAVGIGFLLSGAVAYRLSKAWGLMNGKPPHEGPRLHEHPQYGA